MKKDKLSILLEFFAKDQIQNTSEYLKYFKEYIDVLIHVTNSLSESQEQMPRYKTKIEMLLVKYALTTKTLINLYDGTKLDSKYFPDLTIVDIPSTFVLARSLMENYLTIYYLFIESKTNEDILAYRNWIFEMSALCKRQDLGKERDLPPEIIKKKNEEANMIEILRSVIEENLEFQKLNAKEKKKVLNAPNHRVPSKLFSWTKLFEMSKLSNDIFGKYWKIYSNYAHSEYLSIMQLESLFMNPNNFKVFQFQTLKVQVLLICHLISEVVGLFECTRIRYEEQDSTIKEEIEIWNKIATMSMGTPATNT